MSEITLLQTASVRQWLHSRKTQRYQERSMAPSFNLVLNILYKYIPINLITAKYIVVFEWQES